MVALNSGWVWTQTPSIRHWTLLSFCALVCTLSNNSVLFEGNLQLSNISRHNGSDDHRKAVEADNLRRSRLLKDDTLTSTSTTEHDQPRPLKVSDRVLFNTVLYGAKHVLPNEQVNSLLDLQRLNGLKCKHRDLHSDTVLDIQKSLVFVLDSLLNVELKECSAFSILCDESTDLSVHKNLIVYIRYVSRDGTPQTKLLGNVKIESNWICSTKIY